MTKPYKSYLFRDKDPVIDRLRTLIQDQKVSYARIERESGVTSWTLRNWFEGATRRPQHATVAAVAAVLGYEVSFTPKRSANVVPLRKAVR